VRKEKGVCVCVWLPDGQISRELAALIKLPGQTEAVQMDALPEDKMKIIGPHHNRYYPAWMRSEHAAKHKRNNNNKKQKMCITGPIA